MTSPYKNEVSIERRKFLRTAAAASCSIPFSAVASFAGVRESKSCITTHFVFDRRVCGSLHLDFEGTLSPTLTHAFAGDITPIWRDVLEPLWHQRRVATGGLTRHTEFFLMRTLAAEHGYKVLNTDEYADHVFWFLSPH